MRTGGAGLVCQTPARGGPGYRTEGCQDTVAGMAAGTPASLAGVCRHGYPRPGAEAGICRALCTERQRPGLRGAGHQPASCRAGGGNAGAGGTGGQVMNEAVQRCGVIAIVGRPNVGKSTLMNHLLGQKVSITSRKPQTTRHRIHGILTEDNCQMVFADTPGIHGDGGRALNRYMNQAAVSALGGVDIVCFMVDALKWTEADQYVLSLLPRDDTPVLLLINKIDTLDDKAQLLPHIERLAALYPFAAVIPVSALREGGLDDLREELKNRLPEAPFWFDEDQITDRSLRCMVAEIIREKVVRQLGQEVPHQVAVEIE